MIMLNMNEIPYPPPPHVLKAAEEGLGKMNRYADQEDLHTLKELLADYSGVPEKHIVTSPGSDLLLRDIILSFSRDRKLVMFSPSFLPTAQASAQFARKIVRLRLSPPSFDIKPDMLLEELNGPSLLIIENPNNPTGRLLLDRETLKKVLNIPDILCVIDEAYFEFSGLTFAGLVPHYPNLAVSRSMDKSFGLAGARIGYLLAGEVFLKSFSSFYGFLPRSSLMAAIAALHNHHYKDDRIQKIIAERNRLEKLVTDAGFFVVPSEANFLLVRTGREDTALRLMEQDILVADMANRLAPGYIRVTVGTPAENDAFVDALRKI